MTLLMMEKSHTETKPVTRPHKLTRNNMELAGVIVFFFSLAVAFVMTIIVMMCQNAA